MKSSKSILIFALALVLSSLNLKAQSYLEEEIPKFRHQAKIGYPIEIGLNLAFPNTGMHISYNPTYKLNDFISAEAQASFTYADFQRNSSTFARDGGDAQSLNFLGGGRLYILGESSPIRFYINAMAGLLQFVSSEFDSNDELVKDTGYSLGISTGFFAQYQNTWSLGVSLETKNFLVVRGGYTF